MSALETSAVLGLGLLAGVHHAATGPDHLAGVAPFAARAGRGAWRVGITWGLGHASGAGLAAIAALLLRAALPGVEERLSAISETLVGILLCAIGFFGLLALVRGRAHAPAHEHSDEPGDIRFAHPHAHRFRRHAGGEHTADHEQRRENHARSAFVLGLFHGAAGLAHLFAVLPALALPGHVLPAVYLGGYAAGSLTAIAVFAVAIGWAGRWKDRGARAPLASLAITSAASLVVGVVWLVQSV